MWIMICGKSNGEYDAGVHWIIEGKDERVRSQPALPSKKHLIEGLKSGNIKKVSRY